MNNSTSKLIGLEKKLFLDDQWEWNMILVLNQVQIRTSSGFYGHIFSKNNLKTFLVFFFDIVAFPKRNKIGKSLISF